MQNHLQSTNFGASTDEETPPSSSSFQPTKKDFREIPPSPPPPSLNQPSINRQASQASPASSLANKAVPQVNSENNKNQNNNSSNQRFINQASGEIINSRPSSQLSHTGSSGYGSTRSQVGPFAKNVVVDPSATSTLANRPSPAGSSTSGVSSGAASSTEKGVINKGGILKNSSKRSVWWGGSSMRGIKSGRSSSEESRPSSEMGAIMRASPAVAGPQFASLRIPNRIRHSNSQGDLPSHVSEESISEPGIELVDAEVDSTGGGEINPEMMVINIKNLSELNGGDDKLSVAVPKAAPRYNSNLETPTSEKPGYMNIPPYPLRHSSSLESQVSLLYVLFILFFI